MNSICNRVTWIDINHESEMYRGLFRTKSFRCKGSGYFFDGIYGYYGTTSYTRGFWFWLLQRWHNFWRFTVWQTWYNVRHFGRIRW